MTYGLESNIPISWIDMPAGEAQFPVLRMTTTIEYFANFDFISKLVGGMPREEMPSCLLRFWRRFAQQCPDHQVFGPSTGIALERAIPVMIHGDEGRGYKKTGIMLLSLQGCIGQGCRPFFEMYPSKADRDDRMPLNLHGSSFNSRFLFAAMARKHYSTHPDTWLSWAFRLGR